MRMMDPTQSILVELVLLLIGLLTLFSPYIFRDLFLISTNKTADKNRKVPSEPNARQKWAFKSIFRAIWLYLIVVSALILFDLYELLF